MKITMQTSKPNISRQDLHSGDVFCYKDCFYIAIYTIGYEYGDYVYDSINLSNGEPVYIGDEKVYQIDYEFIVK